MPPWDTNPWYDFLQIDPEKLESAVNEAKKLHIEAKLKAKGLSSGAGTPISTSRPGKSINVPVLTTKIITTFLPIFT